MKVKAQIEISPPEISASPVGAASNLIDLLCNEKGRRYLGRGLALRIEVLAQLQVHSRSLYSIAKEYGVSRQAVSAIAKRARAVYGTSTGS
jgi:hypothetical protein